MSDPTKSLLSIDVDFEQPGKQLGNIRVPVSTNSAGWANYFIPICVVSGGEGPTAVVFGGNHGDEYEGPVAIMNLAREVRPEDVSGRLIMVPMLNRPAVVAGTRLSPLDGENMNRAFPGRHDDTITGQIAHFVSSEILPSSDLVIDIHSGGSSMHMLPSVNMHRLDNNEQMDRMLAAAHAWKAPYIFLYRDVAGAGLLPSLAEQMGKTTLGTEMGSKAQFGVETMAITQVGLRRVLRHAGVLQSNALAKTDEPRYDSQVVAADQVEDYVLAPCSGIFEPFVELGAAVQEGQRLGQIHSHEELSRPATEVLALSSGILFSRRAIPLTAQGECVGVVTRPE